MALPSAFLSGAEHQSMEQNLVEARSETLHAFPQTENEPWFPEKGNKKGITVCIEVNYGDKRWTEIKMHKNDVSVNFWIFFFMYIALYYRKGTAY